MKIRLTHISHGSADWVNTATGRKPYPLSVELDIRLEISDADSLGHAIREVERRLTGKVVDDGS